MRRVIFATLSTVVGLIMLLSFKTHAIPTAATSPSPAVSSPTAPSTDPQATTGSASTGSASTGSASTGSASATPTTSASATGAKTVTGTAADTRYGPVQVRITLTDGQISAVEAVVYPEESGRDQQINSYAVPQLNQEASAAKSANIDMISGATYTSNGYITSLQSALNQAGLS
jgi:uncharacterized protein with FMN-binding domain